MPRDRRPISSIGTTSQAKVRLPFPKRSRYLSPKGHATFPQKVRLPFPKRSRYLPAKGQATDRAKVRLLSLAEGLCRRSPPHVGFIIFAYSPKRWGDDFGFRRVGRKAVGGKNGAVVRGMRGTKAWNTGPKLSKTSRLCSEHKFFRRLVAHYAPLGASPLGVVQSAQASEWHLYVRKQRKCKIRNQQD